MLRVLENEHRQNYRALVKSSGLLAGAAALAPESYAAANLLKFYAVEVGLKYLLSGVLKIPFRHQVPSKSDPHVEKFSHDLISMVAELKIPAGRVPTPPAGPFKCSSPGNPVQQFSLSAAHEAWRYGLKVDPADEHRMLAYLNGLVAYLNQEVPV